MSCFLVARSTSIVSCPTSVGHFSCMYASGLFYVEGNALLAPPAIATLTILNAVRLVLL
jgi:hypothetical protein